MPRWARAECKRRGENESPNACREKLQGVQYLIRWPISNNNTWSSDYQSREQHNIIFRYLTLTPEQFIGSPACPPSPLLTEEESDALHIAILVQGVINAYKQPQTMFTLWNFYSGRVIWPIFCAILKKYFSRTSMREKNWLMRSVLPSRITSHLCALSWLRLVQLRLSEYIF